MLISEVQQDELQLFESLLKRFNRNKPPPSCCTPGCWFLQDEVHRQLLPVLPAVPGPGRGLRGVRVRMEPPVARRLRLGRLSNAVQLAPGADGDGYGRRLRLR